MEGVNGYDFFYTEKTIPVTNLRIDGKQVMTDDVMHWMGMQKLAKESKGNVLVGGLGLGLIVHALAKNPKVKRIDVIELNKDVIKLVKPLIPKKNVNVFRGDVYNEKWLHMDYDTIILDLWVVNGKKVVLAGVKGKRDMRLDILDSIYLFKTAYPKSNVFIWGSRSQTFNPSVKKKPNDFYLDFVRHM